MNKEHTMLYPHFTPVEGYCTSCGKFMPTGECKPQNELPKEVKNGFPYCDKEGL